jgi:hypothetical protein
MHQRKLTTHSHKQIDTQTTTTTTTPNNGITGSVAGNIYVDGGHAAEVLAEALVQGAELVAAAIRQHGEAVAAATREVAEATQNAEWDQWTQVLIAVASAVAGAGTIMSGVAAVVALVRRRRRHHNRADEEAGTGGEEEEEVAEERPTGSSSAVAPATEAIQRQVRVMHC